jgi:hypothetical protein
MRRRCWPRVTLNPKPDRGCCVVLRRDLGGNQLCGDTPPEVLSLLADRYWYIPPTGVTDLGACPPPPPALPAPTSGVVGLCSSAIAAWSLSGNSLVARQGSWFFNDTIGGRLAAIDAGFQQSAGGASSLGSQPVLFLGTDRAVTLPAVTVGTNFSVFMWVMPISWTTQETLFSLQFDATTWASVGGGYFSTNGGLALYVGGSLSGFSQSANLPNAAWTHLCLTFTAHSTAYFSSGYMVAAYANGTSVYNAFSAGGTLTPIGWKYDYSAYNGTLLSATVGSKFNGYVKNFQLLNFVLSSDAVNSLYAESLCPQPCCQ